ncbi:uncharacterized protein LOC126559138 [Anopheles maculipalpis]|uniref:uncharacterized protein LOC126559138 n=1 Tax=Anopheles maculipalpis TaxID=1496333 RepID=UPI002159095F|nr:uncharacterized protein LOC126559138 [Anopheles maculipalpis]
MAEDNTNGPAPAAEAVPQDAAPEEPKAASEGGEASDAEQELEPSPEPQISTFARLKQFLAETNSFLGKYDDLVENKDKHKSVYLNTVNELRELLVTLLQRYILHTMVREDFLYKHIVCCGEDPQAMNTEEFDEHYAEVHSEADKAISLPELDEIRAYTAEVKTYIELGKAMNNDLIFSLKRLLRKSNSVLAGHLG